MITYGVVLAAGAGLRFGGPKAPYLYKGERLVDTAVANLRSGGCDRVIVVLGAWFGEVRNADEILLNPEWESGLSTSLAVAIKHVLETPADRICLTLVDLPGLTPQAVAKVLASKSELAQATYRKAPTHPVLLNRVHWTPLLTSLAGDEGARKYLRQHDEQVEKIAIDDLAIGEDLDFQPT